MSDGLFVTVEGIDGSGTTSVVEGLSERFEDAVKTAEPSGLWTGEIAREAFEGRDVSDLARFYLFQADRAEHCAKRVDPALEDGFLVICDRGPDSTRAYQYHTTDLSEEFIEMNLAETTDPDLTLWLDVPVDVAVERDESVDGDAFSHRSLQRKVCQRYYVLEEQHDRIERINAAQPLPDVIEEAAAIIEANL